MKLSIALFTLLAGIYAQASQYPVIRFSQLTPLKIDSNHFSEMVVEAVTISVDETNQLVRLAVAGSNKYENVCLSLDCAIAPKSTYQEIVLPIVKEIASRCGVRVITAQLDARPVDGRLSTIEIQDRQQLKGDRCTRGRTGVKVKYVTEHVSRRDSAKVQDKSLFFGKPLEILEITVQEPELVFPVM